MLAAALSTVKGDVAAARGLAKVLRAEAKRHNSAKAADAFAMAGGAAAAVAAVNCYFRGPPEPVKAATDSVAALADLAAAGGAAQSAVIGAGAARSVESVLRNPGITAASWNIRAALYIQVCRLAGNLCFGGAKAEAVNWFTFVNAFVDVAVFADDATTFRWAAHAIWNACTHSTSTRDVVDSNKAVESLVKGASRFPGTPRAYGLRALAYVVLGSEARRQSALREGVALVLMDATRDEPGTAAAALLCISSVVGPCGTAHLARWSGVADRADGLANITAKLAAVALEGGGDAAAVSAGIVAVARGARDPRSFRAAVMPLLRDAVESATRPRARKALGAALHALQPRRHLYNVGAEAEAAGRAVPKNMQILRKDLAQLPWVLARPGDVVVAPPLSDSLAARLEAAGVARETLPSFGDVASSVGGRLALPEDILRTVLGYLVDAPWAVADERLRRSHVTRYRHDVVVCASLDDVAAAARANDEGTILKAEYSSSGLGARTVARELTEQDEAWARNRLKADGVLTAEPRFELETEFTLEWYDGFFCGVSRPIVVPPGRWQGQNLGATDDLRPDMVEAVFGRRRWLESFMAPTDVPGTCGSATCGVDVGLVRVAGGTRAEVLECNARTTMSHIALAAKRRVPNAARFLVLPKRDLAPHHLPLTDGEDFVAVLELGDDSGPFPFVDDPDNRHV